MIKRFSVLISTIILAFMFIGCGNNEVAPEGSEITFGVGDVSVSDGGAFEAWSNMTLLPVIVKNADGLPLNNVKIAISYPWAVPSTYGVVQFYKNGVAVNSPMTVTTDETGTYVINYRFQSGGGLEYSGDFLAISGSSSAIVELAVTVPTG